MTLRCLMPLALKFGGRTVQFEPGSVFTVTPAQAQRVLAKFPAHVETLDLPPDLLTEPLQPGWLVVYRDRAGRLAGGCDDRGRGVVKECRWNGSAWLVRLTNGGTLALRSVLSVGKTDATGKIIAAWTVRECGVDGEGGQHEQ